MTLIGGLCTPKQFAREQMRQVWTEQVKGNSIVTF
ncbi:hypothetical protein Rhom172_2853 (plasmid) [Rhodothermus marinus SG0.5JP17-172]|nr:hypothetical protein Rhom172_2853 [Rhodothermus marinus SG0.5JP17-172]